MRIFCFMSAVRHTPYLIIAKDLEEAWTVLGHHEHPSNTVDTIVGDLTGDLKALGGLDSSGAGVHVTDDGHHLPGEASFSIGAITVTGSEAFVKEIAELGKSEEVPADDLDALMEEAEKFREALKPVATEKTKLSYDEVQKYLSGSVRSKNWGRAKRILDNQLSRIIDTKTLRGDMEGVAKLNHDEWEGFLTKVSCL